MNTLRIKTHKMKNNYAEPHFFILSKGLNAGRPQQKACPNCFVLLTDTEAEKNKLFWLCFGLWQGQYFHKFLTGSVIPFIRLNDLKSVLCQAAQKVIAKNDELIKSIDILNKISTHQENINHQLTLLKQAKKALMYKLLK